MLFYLYQSKKDRENSNLSFFFLFFLFLLQSNQRIFLCSIDLFLSSVYVVIDKRFSIRELLEHNDCTLQRTTILKIKKEMNMKLR